MGRISTCRVFMPEVSFVCPHLGQTFVAGGWAIGTAALRFAMVSSLPPSGDFPLDQPLLPLVDEDVGDEGRLHRPDSPVRLSVAGRQALQFGSPVCGLQQGLQFLFSLLHRLFLRHHSSLLRSRHGGRAGRHGIQTSCGGGFWFDEVILRTRLDELSVIPSLVPLVDWYLEEYMAALSAAGTCAAGRRRSCPAPAAPPRPRSRYRTG